jgi:hypothetical protein
VPEVAAKSTVGPALGSEVRSACSHTDKCLPNHYALAAEQHKEAAPTTICTPSHLLQVHMAPRQSTGCIKCCQQPIPQVLCCCKQGAVIACVLIAAACGTTAPPSLKKPHRSPTTTPTSADARGPQAVHLVCRILPAIYPPSPVPHS